VDTNTRLRGAKKPQLSKDGESDVAEPINFVKLEDSLQSLASRSIYVFSRVEVNNLNLEWR